MALYSTIFYFNHLQTGDCPLFTMQNIISIFFETAQKRKEKTCAITKRSGQWVEKSWSDVAKSVLEKASCLAKLGICKGDRVAILANTSLEWTIADCAILATGGITVPIYCSLPPERIAYILKDSLPKLAIVENKKIAELFSEAANLAGLSSITIICIEEAAGLNSFSEIGKDASQSDIAQIKKGIKQISPEDPATYVYTSGTTGELKGVVITHGMITAEIRACQKVFGFEPDEVGLACLPLAHVLGRMMQFYQLAQGTIIAYAESIEKLAENYMEARPHYACVVPRMLEKIHERAEEVLRRSSFLSQKIAKMAIAVGREHSSYLQKHRKVPLPLAMKYWLAEILVFRRLRARLGGRIHSFICGGARLAMETIRFLHAAGIIVQEGYGLTETFAAVTVNRRDDYHFGTVGKPLPGVSIKLAADGEVLIKGPIVFREYLNKPDETKAAFDEEGWFRSGDLGEYSRDGFLRITGRKKDMIVTAGGKNIAPQMIEEIMCSSPFISNFMVYGDGRRFLIAIVTLNYKEVLQYLKSNGHDVDETTKLSANPVVKKLIQAHIDGHNQKLARYETIKKFAILENDFSIAAGELTSTMKMRREFISEKYRDVFESLYRE